MAHDTAGWTERRLAVGDHVFELAEQGEPSGRPVLLLHGFPQTHRCFDAVAARLLADSATPLRLLAPDQRGYSPGARPTGVAAYAMDELVGDALAILDACGVEAADVVGHDWGAAIAWNLAARHPERVRTLTAVSVPHAAALTTAISQDADQKERSAYIRLFRQPEKAEQVLLEDGAKRLRAIYDPLPAAVAEPHFAALSDPETLTAALNWYRAMTTAQESMALPKVTVPVTYVWSTADIAVGRMAASLCSRYVTGPYGFVELEGISHWIPEQTPDALAAEILAQVDRA